MRFTVRQYRQFATDAILAMLHERHAVIRPEIEARAAEREHHPSPVRVDPHHLGEALDSLITRGVVTETAPTTTRGGRGISVIHLSDLTRRRTKVAAAARRKRLLYARYLSWATGTLTQPSLIGPAGERATLRALTAAAPTVGYRLENPAGGATATVQGVPVPVGPLDNAAAFIDFATGDRYLVLVEVKNVRAWIMPGGDELPQLLTKAAQLTPLLPGWKILPVLVCRRAQKITFRMAKSLGFHIIDTYRQYLPAGPFDPAVHPQDAAQLTEVRTELGFTDLVADDTPEPRRHVNQFATVLPRRAAEIADRWHNHGALFESAYDTLRQTTSVRSRLRILSPVRKHPDDLGGW